MKLLPVSISLLLFITAASLPAAEIKIANGSLTPGKKIAPGAAAIPSKWKLTEGDKGNCVKWVGKDAQGNDISHLAIGSGITLSQTFDLPALSEKETKVKGSWNGILMVDTLGVSKKGTGRWTATLTNASTDEKITSLTGKAANIADPNNQRTHRLWKALPAKMMKEIEGKKLTVTLSVKGTGPVVVSGVSLCRLHSAPSSKLFGRSNGGAGPDLLGVGSLGFDGMTEHMQRVLTVIKVRQGTPAEKAGLKAGDQIIAINRIPLAVNNLNPGWQWFHHSHEATIGRAVAAAWSAKPPVGKGRVELGLLRNGKPVSLRCELNQAIDFQDILASKNKDVMHAQLIEFLTKNQQKNGSWRGPIRTTFAALALLATQDPAHAPRIKSAVDWMLNKYPEPENFGNLGFWHGSYAGILYCEYYLATGDARVLPRIAPLLDWILSGTHTSKWGMTCLGHGVSGLPYGQKALVAPAAHALVFDALAEKCGVKSGLWKTLLPYMEHSWSDPAKGGHGAMGYNASYKDKGEFWSRSGLFSMAAHLRTERTDMETAMIGFMRGHYPWFRNSHAYGEPGGAIGLLALNLCEPEAYQEVMKAYGWWFALAWDPGHGLRFTTPHMGAPYMGTEDLINATYALVFAAPKRNLFITGGEKRNWLDVSNLETPTSPVLMRRDKVGNVTLACRIPGPHIRYTLDGTEPTKDSTLYQKPIPFPTGGTVKAKAYGKTIKPGETATQNFGPAKAGWTVLAASGHKDPKEAIRKASYAVDHSPTHSWLTDVGQDAKGYPHFIVIDLGQETQINSVDITFIRDAGACQNCVVKTSNSLTQMPKEIASAKWESFTNTQTVKVEKPSKARYLRLEFDSPVKEKSLSLMIREIEIK